VCVCVCVCARAREPLLFFLTFLTSLNIQSYMEIVLLSLEANVGHVHNYPLLLSLDFNRISVVGLILVTTRQYRISWKSVERFFSSFLMINND